MTNIYFYLIDQVLSAQHRKRRQREITLSLTLASIVLKHLLCNLLRIFLGILVVSLVGQILHITLNPFSQWVRGYFNHGSFFHRVKA